MQLKGKVAAVFGDAWVRGGADQFQANIGLLGGADFTSHFVEARVATPRFPPGPRFSEQGRLLGGGEGRAAERTLHSASTSRPRWWIRLPEPTRGEAPLRAQPSTSCTGRSSSAVPPPPSSDAAYTLLEDLVTIAAGPVPQDGWSGVCEALVRHPDFLLTLPPRGRAAARHREPDAAPGEGGAGPGGPAADRRRRSGVHQRRARRSTRWWTVARLGRVPRLRYYKMRIRTESDGTSGLGRAGAAVDAHPHHRRPAFRELLTGDYGVDASFQKVARGPEHGDDRRADDEGLHPAQARAAPLQLRGARPHGLHGLRSSRCRPRCSTMRIGATASSTVDPNSICFTCHQLLTPLAYQRSRWSDDGTYQHRPTRTGRPIDDSDHGLVAGVPVQGTGDGGVLRAGGEEGALRPPDAQRRSSSCSLAAPMRLRPGRARALQAALGHARRDERRPARDAEDDRAPRRPYQGN